MENVVEELKSGLTQVRETVKSKKNKEFLFKVYSHLIDELTNISHDDPESTFSNFQEAFNKIIEHMVAYRPLLSRLKNEYDVNIEALHSDLIQSRYLNAKLKEIGSQPTTLRNYSHRIEELEERIKIIEHDNELLKLKLASTKELYLKLKNDLSDKDYQNYDQHPYSALPGLTLDESLDLEILKEKNESISKTLDDITAKFTKEFMPTAVASGLKINLLKEMSRLDDLKSLEDKLSYKLEKIRIARNAATAYNQIRPPHMSLREAVFTALYLAARIKNGQTLSPEERFLASLFLGKDYEVRRLSLMEKSRVDDPEREKEAELILEAIERFNDLFNSGSYEAAAYHAACSYKGILRNMATLLRFKEVIQTSYMKRSPLMAFCQYVMDTVPSCPSIPNEEMSLEFIKCTLKENLIDILQFWVVNGRLTLTKSVGDKIYGHCHCINICGCKCSALAELVYHTAGHRLDVLKAMIKQDRVQSVVHYCLNQNFTLEDNILVLKNWYSSKLLYAFVRIDPKDRQGIPMGFALHTLADFISESELVDHLLYFINIDTHGKELEDNSLRKLVTKDRQTSLDFWLHLSYLLDKNGFNTESVIFMAEVIVAHAIHSALEIVSQL